MQFLAEKTRATARWLAFTGVVQAWGDTPTYVHGARSTSGAVGFVSESLTGCSSK